MQTKTIKQVTKYCIPGVTLTNKGEYWQIRKIGLTALRVKNDPAFGKTRMKAKQFAQALQWAAKINRVVLPGTNIKQSIGHLAGKLYTMLPPVWPDDNSVFRCIQQQGEALLGFNFNREALWQDTVSFPYRYEYIVQQNQWVFHLPAYQPSVSVKPPEEVTHYRIKTLAITLNKAGSITASTVKQTSLIPCKPITTQQTLLEVNAMPAKGEVSIALLYIQWYQPARTGTAIVSSDKPGVLTITGIYSEFDLS